MIGKIKPNLEDPISVQLYALSEQISPILKKYNFSPNLITISRLIMTIYIHVSLQQKKNYKISGFLVFLIYFLDHLDGHFARKYNMETILGDYLDHFSDLLLIVIIIYHFYKKNIIISRISKYIISILFINSAIFYACEEKILHLEKNKIESKSAKILQPICFFNTKKKIIEYMKLTRYFSYSILYLYVSIMIGMYNKT